MLSLANTFHTHMLSVSLSMLVKHLAKNNPFLPCDALLFPQLDIHLVGKNKELGLPRGSPGTGRATIKAQSLHSRPGFKSDPRHLHYAVLYSMSFPISLSPALYCLSLLLLSNNKDLRMPPKITKMIIICTELAVEQNPLSISLFCILPSCYHIIMIRH